MNKHTYVIVKRSFLKLANEAMQARQVIVDQFYDDMVDHLEQEENKVKAIVTKWWNFSLRDNIKVYYFMLSMERSELERTRDGAENDIKEIEELLNPRHVEFISLMHHDFIRYQDVIDKRKGDFKGLREAVKDFPRITFEEKFGK